MASEIYHVEEVPSENGWVVVDQDGTTQNYNTMDGWQRVFEDKGDADAFAKRMNKLVE